MKKAVFLIILFTLLGAGFYFLEDGTMLLSSDLKSVREQSLSFMEDLRFKDYVKAASYHSQEDRERVDIPKLIEKMFRIKPEQMDLMEYHILMASLDSSGTRARVKIATTVQLLSTENIKNPEVMLYFHKDNDQWYMKLESSLK